MVRSRLLALLLLGCSAVPGCATSEHPPPATAQRAARSRPPGRQVAGPIPSAAARTVHLDLRDVNGQPVTLGAPAQPRVAVVFFLSRESREESGELIGSVDEQTLNAPVDQIGIVDLHKYGGVAVRPFATRQMRKSIAKSLASRRGRREAHGVDASDEVVGRWHLIGDFDGALFDRFQVEKEPMHPVAYVVDRAGGLHGPYREAGSIASAVERLTGAERREARR